VSHYSYIILLYWHSPKLINEC